MVNKMGTKKRLESYFSPMLCETGTLHDFRNIRLVPTSFNKTTGIRENATLYIGQLNMD